MYTCETNTFTFTFTEIDCRIMHRVYKGETLGGINLRDRKSNGTHGEETQTQLSISKSFRA